MHLRQTNSGAGDTIIINFKRVRERKRRSLDPLGNSAGPDIGSSSKLHLPGFKSFFLPFINLSKNRSSLINGLLFESILKLNKGFREDKGVPDTEGGMIPTGGSFIAIKKIELPTRSKPARWMEPLIGVRSMSASGASLILEGIATSSLAARV